MGNNHEIPAEVPVMTLPDTVLFPHASLPLYIFEPRYRQMLDDVLHGDGLFALGTLDPEVRLATPQVEPVYPLATVGSIRAHKRHPDGTSTILLEGLQRVCVDAVLSESPYRRIAVHTPPLPTGASGLPALQDSDHDLIGTLTSQIGRHQKLAEELPPESLLFFQSISDLDVLTDITAAILCRRADEKLRVLEMINPRERADYLIRLLRGENERLEIQKSLQGPLDPEAIQLN